MWASVDYAVVFDAVYLRRYGENESGSKNKNKKTGSSETGHPDHQ